MESRYASISLLSIFFFQFLANLTSAQICHKTCDHGTPICSLLSSCRPIITTFSINSTCCVYTPVNLVPSFEMDLQKLQCSSYSWFYSFNREQFDPYEWNHGIPLKYKFSVTDDYPISCIACERSNGVCGYIRDLNPFLCNCPGGIYTTKDCFFAPHYGVGFRNGVAWLWVFMAWSVVGFFL